MRKHAFFLAGLITIVALALRLYRINLNLPSLYIDEVSSHYQIWANFFSSPVSHLHWSFLSLTWLLGLTPLAVRLPAAIFGSTLVFIFFLMAENIELGKPKERLFVSLAMAALLVFLPWSFHLSRIGYANLPLLLIVIGCHLIFYFRAKNLRTYLLSLLPLILGIWLYPSMIIIFPMALILVGWQAVSLFHRRKLGLLILSFLFLGTLSTMFLLSLDGKRGFDLAIWRDVNTTADSNEARGLARSSLPTIFSFNLNPELGNQLVYNRPVAIINTFVRNYLSFFSVDFLFLKGDPILRHSTGQVGAFYPFLIPFTIYGAFLFFKSDNQKVKQVFLVWILASPVSAALTKDGSGYLLRAVTTMPFLTYFAALGLTQSVKLIKPKLRIVYLVGLSLVVLYSIYYFLFSYFQVYPAKAARSYEFGFKEVSDFQVTQGSKPLLLIWDGYYPHYYFRFWQRTDKKEYRQFVPEEILVNETKVYQMFPNLYFSLPKTEEDLKQFLLNEKVAYLVFPADLTDKFLGYSFLKITPVTVINFPDNTPDFYIYSTEQWLMKK